MKTITVSAGDLKASKGMAELAAMFKQKNITFAQTEFAANAPQAEQNTAVDALLKQGNPHNFIIFTKGTTLPAGADANSKAGEHMYSFDYSYLLESARDWLFQQVKK
ncbi:MULTISPECIES: hypothetical protein [unclassified Neisseria]|uniref:hypothetical protein n=1 Tax=unclassified Neisseria TaxID=2623750 RepID=UPI0010723E29|nr:MULTISPECIES: hypothetical protein [unclassified Neisseria]MBF0805018.1 hypothetical protein [Neisseria sp. 19428wB4_WF04]TFU39240.1 hypothetical protein E4T99_12125 [Neisseria sp. WF04]